VCSQIIKPFLFVQAAKRHLTQRIEKLDDKLDQQKAISGQIRDDVLFPYYHTFFTLSVFCVCLHLVCFSSYLNLMIPCLFELFL
jgi:hypothetical protein